MWQDKKQQQKQVACLQRNHRIWSGRTLRVEKPRLRNIKWLDQGHTNCWRKSKTKARCWIIQSRVISPTRKDTARIFKERIDKTWQVVKWGKWNRELPVHSGILVQSSVWVTPRCASGIYGLFGAEGNQDPAGSGEILNSPLKILNYGPCQQ